MDKHECIGETPFQAYGSAFTHCYEDGEGRLWISNEEYASQANFCPYCGFKALVQVQIVSRNGDDKWDVKWA